MVKAEFQNELTPELTPIRQRYKRDSKPPE